MKKEHPFQPIYDQHSKILILGSLPSVVSVQRGFYYMHPQNRFWKILSLIYQEDVYTKDISAKKEFILAHHLALYDVVLSCEIDQSKDASIQDVSYTDISSILKDSSIQKIILNGSKAYDLFCKQYPIYMKIACKLPSTSSANAKVSFEELRHVWANALLG